MKNRLLFRQISIKAECFFISAPWTRLRMSISTARLPAPTPAVIRRFSFEITDRIREGENRIHVTVRDYSDTREYSRGKQKFHRGQIWYSPQSGIWQTVWLESTPKEYLHSVRITPEYDSEQVRFDFDADCEVLTAVYDGDTLIAETTGNVVKLPNFKSWSPESPFLYNVVFTCGKDRVKSYFGMRKFSTGKDENGIERLF